MLLFMIVVYVLTWMSFLGGYFDALPVIIVMTIIFYYMYRKEQKVQNYDISKVDNAKMAKDAGKSYSTIRTNMINGKYDKDKKEEKK